jgi:hypothetical protein
MPPTPPRHHGPGLLFALMLLAAAAPGCLPENRDTPGGPRPLPPATGGAPGEGGAGGSPAPSYPDAAVTQQGGSGGVAAGTGGSGGSAGGSGGSPALPDAAAGGGRGGSGSGGAGGRAPDAGRDVGGTGGTTGDGANARPTPPWSKIQLLFANCVFCHHDANMRTDLQYDVLHKNIINRPATKLDPSCPVRTLIIPGQPMSSLIYLKVSGKQPSGCGDRMPPKPPILVPSEVEMIYDWILAGAPATE